LTHTIIFCWLTFAASAAADTEGKLLGDVSDGSRAIPVHLHPILDEEGEEIYPDDDPLLPFSTQKTCGECHSVDKISKGWHFNAAEPNVDPGRPGEPRIYVDAAIATQIPLSYRPWPGTFRPEQLGITPSQFVRLFGKHMPGGGIGRTLEETEDPEEIMRSYLTGKLEINCLTCHNAHPGQDQAEYAVQIARENFRWAAAAACEFACVTGSTTNLPDTYDYRMPEFFDDPKITPPTLRYKPNTFDSKNQIFFDIVREVPAQRCYFCHSTIDLDSQTGPEKWTAEQDVHLSAGLTCVDCHRNGLAHDITRGYVSEASVSTNPFAAASSCQSCHLPEESPSASTAGRLGAPEPKHGGIPPVHFDKLTCTACHSGPLLKQKTHRLKTSQAHALGTLNVNKSYEVLPHITGPVFAEQPDGKIAPHNLIWPAFWASIRGREVVPIALEIIRPIAAKVIEYTSTHTGDWPNLTAEQLTKILALLSSQTAIEAEPVYICAGRLHRLDHSGQLISQGHPAAKPYLWPIAHNVRPTAQSLGAGRCEDCHSIDAAFSFGQVPVDSPLALDSGSAKTMVEFQDINPFYMKIFDVSFVFRPLLKVVALGSSAILAAILLLYGLKALSFIARILVGKD